MRKKVTRIGILITGTLEDALVSVPIVRYLRALSPESEVYLLCEKQGNRPTPAEVFLPLGLADKVAYLHADNETGRLSLWQIWRAGLLALFHRVQRLHLITSATRSEKSITVMRWTLRDTLIGRLNGFRSFPKNTCLPHDQTSGKATETRHELYWRLQRLNIQETPASILEKYPLHIPELISKNLLHTLSALNLPDSNFIAIAPRSGMSSKDWPYDNWVQLLLELTQNQQRTVYLLGGERERVAFEFFTVVNSRIHNLAGKLSFMESVALLQRADSFIGLDSALSHAAAMLGVPSVIIFSGQSHPGLWTPLAIHPPSFRLLTHPTNCCGCLKKVCPLEEHPCIKNITVESVLKALDYVCSVPHKSS